MKKQDYVLLLIKNKKMERLKFAKLSEDENKKLIGGFSISFTNETDSRDFITNNCAAGNCKTGCKSKNKLKSIKENIPNSNCKAGANCVKRCGK